MSTTTAHPVQSADPAWHPDPAIGLDPLQNAQRFTSLKVSSDWEYEALTEEPQSEGLYIGRAHLQGSGRALISSASDSGSAIEPSQVTRLGNEVHPLFFDATLHCALHPGTAINLPSSAINLYQLESTGIGPVSQIVLALYSMDQHLRSAGPDIPVFLPAQTRLISEISKFRAMRLAIDHLVAIHGRQNYAAHFHAITSSLELGRDNPDNNLVRTTIQATGAVLGGVHRLSIQPWNLHDQGYADENAARLSLNISLLLKHEGHLDRVADSLAGSHSVESATHAMVRLAWERFVRIQHIAVHDLLNEPLVKDWLTEDCARYSERSLVDESSPVSQHIGSLSDISSGGLAP